MSTTSLALYTANPDDLLMQAEARGVQVSNTDRRAIVSGAGVPIAKIDTGKLVEGLGAILKIIAGDLGIHKGIDPLDATRFSQYLRNYFPNMTLGDVKHAFEYYVAGELDKLLPRDKAGQVVQHYQSFSAAFYIPVLRAYRVRQQEAKMSLSNKVEHLLLAEQTPRDPKAVRADMLALLKGVAVALCDGEAPSYFVTDTTMGILWDCGLLPASFEVTDDDIRTAKARSGRGGSISIGAAIKDGLVPEHIMIGARLSAVRREFRAAVERIGKAEVAARFDRLIAECSAQ